MIPNNQFFYNNKGSTWPSPEIIGEIVADNFTSGNWTQVGANTTWTFNASDITTVGTAGAFSPLIRYNQWFSQIENFTMRATYSVTLANQVFLGVGISPISTFSTGGYSFYAYMSTASGDNGAIYIYSNNTIRAQDLVNTVSYSLNDDIEVYFTVADNVITATFQNVTTAGPVRTISYTITTPFAYPLAERIPVLFQPTFQNARGNYVIKDWDFSSQSYKNIDLLLIGDSKTEGFYAGSYAARNANLWGSNNLTKKVQVSAGSGDVTQDILNNMPEILLQNPRKVILFIGRNDLSNGVASGTWQANYASIVTQLENLGTEVWHQLPTPEGVLNQTSLTNYINATYSNIISVPPTWNIATDTDDNIHPNSSGYLKLYNQQSATFII